MFKTIKQKLLNQNNMGRYLSYAAGEVILIVIGILVAVSINNWNEERQQKKVVNGIFAVLINDIKQDTAEVNQILDFYNKKKSTFLKIAHDTLTNKEISECDLCPALISSRELFSINRRGINQLNEYNNYALSNQDSLVFDLVNFYARLTDEVENFNDLINDDVIGNLVYWRDNYPWFASSMQGRLKKEDWSYFGSQEFKNRVAFHYVLIYENYFYFLQTFQQDSKAILKELNKRLNDNL
jgi:hypothetical protein